MENDVGNHQRVSAEGSHVMVAEPMSRMAADEGIIHALWLDLMARRCATPDEPLSSLDDVRQSLMYIDEVGTHLAEGAIDGHHVVIEDRERLLTPEDAVVEAAWIMHLAEATGGVTVDIDEIRQQIARL